MHFDPKRGFWRQDDKDGVLTATKLKSLAGVVREEAAHLLRFAATLAASGRDTDARAMSRAANDLLSHAKQIERQAFLSGAAKFLAGDQKQRAEVAQFAPKAWKFAFKNCVFDCGQWRAARREDFLLHVSPVEMNNRADRREWMMLLNRITGGDELFARTLQEVCAYALSGASTLRKLPWLYGPGGAGKSTLCEMLQTLIGEGAATVDPSHLTDKAQREKLGAVIWGKRAAFVSEAGNQRIDAELLKTLSGGDRISACFKYREAFTALPSHVLILAANDPPRTDAYDDALKERVIALPFEHRLDEGEPLQFAGHKRLESARRDPNSVLIRGFAAWVAEGLERLFQTQELFCAPAVVTATAKFWADTDPLTPYWETVPEWALEEQVSRATLRADYANWCQSNGRRPLDDRRWSTACRAVGLEEGTKVRGERHWRLNCEWGADGAAKYPFFEKSRNVKKDIEGFWENRRFAVPSAPRSPQNGDFEDKTAPLMEIFDAVDEKFASFGGGVKRGSWLEKAIEASVCTDESGFFRLVKRLEQDGIIWQTGFHNGSEIYRRAGDGGRSAYEDEAQEAFA